MGSDKQRAANPNDLAPQAEGSIVYRLVTSLLLFGLLAEWLLPWTGAGEWSVIYHPMPLLAIVGFMLAAGLFRMPWILSFLVHAMICVFCLMWLYKGEGQSSVDWLVALPALIGDNVALMTRSGLWAMSGELRTLMLFAGWAMLAPALQALVWIRQAALGIAAVTLAYLALLHAWLGMDVLGGFLRTTAEGLLLAAIVTVPRVRRVLDISEERLRGIDKSWLAGAMFVTLVIAGGALLATVDRESELAPAKWTTAMTDRLQQGISSIGGDGKAVATMRHLNGGQLGRALTGYGFDDSELGMPLSSDDRILFKGLSPVRAYWRGETKATYDGRGWSSAEWPLTLKPVTDGEKEKAAAASPSEGGNLAGREVVQTLVWEDPIAEMPIFASGVNGTVTELIAADPRRKLGSYLASDGADALYAATDTAKLARYSVRSYLPVTDAKALRALGGEGTVHANGGGTAEAGEATARSGDTMEVTDARLKPYLQLPSSLPDRVVALASEVAGAGMTNLYDRVKAVEVYLESTYAYTKSGSETPPADSDFVDHFLFEQRQGYCVHFSTAMVVMLRSQGIPARWVKGFTSGDDTGELGQAVDGMGAERVYEVRGSDAHAWVEVYMPGAGWVPFDPTPGFGGAATVASATGGGTGAAAGADGTVPAGLAEGATGLERFEAAAEEAASMVARAAAALAEGARSAWDAAEASPGAAAAAGGAALAAAAAALAVAQRRRQRLRRALRRYGAASEALARQVAPGGAAGSAPAGQHAGDESVRESSAGQRAVDASVGESSARQRAVDASVGERSAAGQRAGDASVGESSAAGQRGSGARVGAISAQQHRREESVGLGGAVRLARGSYQDVGNLELPARVNGNNEVSGELPARGTPRLNRSEGEAARLTGNGRTRAAIASKRKQASDRALAEQQRSTLIEAAEAVMDLLRSRLTQNTLTAETKGTFTLREEAGILGATIGKSGSEALDRIVHWLEAARYEPPGALRNAPSGEELRQTCHFLIKSVRSGNLRKNSAATQAQPNNRSHIT
jgi:transglutaminase-like putative cysteine protease